ncbi:MAG TPA: HAMP domain-containing sensor histidine kinase, partial [Chitinophagaceae bacterium]|nr:HAMP domain-containing sensor histidine kinase [Chitinophagaceae bacterium]
ENQAGNDPAFNLLADRAIPDFLNQTIPVSEKYTESEINAIVHKFMSQNGVDGHYEFGIGTNIGFTTEFPIQSPQFLAALDQSYKDTLHTRRCIFALSNFGIAVPASQTFWLIVKEPRNFVIRSLGMMISGSMLFTLILITAFALTVSTMLRQKKISEIKSDFINNMTHELKTPLATISLAVDAIVNEKVMASQDKIKYFTGIIKEENRRMHSQVENILQSALLEKKEIKLNIEEVDLHQAVRKSIANFQLQLQHKHAELETRFSAEHTMIHADQGHLGNVISNLLDNAIKYSREKPQITISTENVPGGILLSIADNGIGMSKETQAKIFEKFYRAHTGNLHNVKGFGLGLAYVKAIMDAHHGKVSVESRPAAGSKFTLEFRQESR